MKPYLANLINSIILITFGIWGYLGSETPSFTALIPTIAGLVLIIFTPSMKNGSKISAHVVVTLTILLLIAFYKPLSGALQRGNVLAITRVFVMMTSSTIALAVYIKSFIDARRKK